MSQRVRIHSVKIAGLVYVGEVNEADLWTSNPVEVMNWLADGWRGLYNNFRSQRFGSDIPLTPSQYRHSTSYRKALPSSIMQGTKWLEQGDWFGALRAIKTVGHGGVPRFKRLKDGRTFATSGSGYTSVHRLSKHRGELLVTGKNPATQHGPGINAHWSVSIRFNWSQEIRAYTSARVNLTRGTISFVNEPLPIQRSSTGSVIGIDVGITHTLSSSNGEFFDIPRPSASQALEYKNLQKKMARQDRVNLERGGKTAKFGSKRRQKTVAKIGELASKQTRRRSDWIDKVTTVLVQEHDIIVLENLRPGKMSRKGRDKQSLNRGILESCWGKFQSTLSYKVRLAEVQIMWVNPAYTSQACHECGHIARENRESQAAFLCVSCGYMANADINAALNILNRGLVSINGVGQTLERGAQIRPLENALALSVGTSVESLTSEAEVT